MTGMTKRKLVLILIFVFSLVGFRNSYADLSKTIEVAVLTLKSETVATAPANRNRTTIGIGEEVILSVIPAVSVNWSVTGDGSVMPPTGTTTTFTASQTPSTSTVHAVIGAVDIQIVFTVIAPTSITSVKKTDVGLGAPGPPNNYIGAYTLYDITVNPTTVSFYNATLRENIPAHSWTWPNGTIGGLNARTPGWSIDYANKTIDNISSGPYPIGYINNGAVYVNFNYIVNWNEEYKDQKGIWTTWFSNETRNTEYRGSDQKCRQTHMGGVGGWQGPWQ